jgi:hypothetical protein
MRDTLVIPSFPSLHSSPKSITQGGSSSSSSNPLCDSEDEDSDEEEDDEKINDGEDGEEAEKKEMEKKEDMEVEKTAGRLVRNLEKVSRLHRPLVMDLLISEGITSPPPSPSPSSSSSSFASSSISIFEWFGAETLSTTPFPSSSSSPPSPPSSSLLPSLSTTSFSSSTVSPIAIPLLKNFDPLLHLPCHSTAVFESKSVARIDRIFGSVASSPFPSSSSSSPSSSATTSSSVLSSSWNELLNEAAKIIGMMEALAASPSDPSSSSPSPSPSSSSSGSFVFSQPVTQICNSIVHFFGIASSVSISRPSIQPPKERNLLQVSSIFVFFLSPSSFSSSSTSSSSLFLPFLFSSSSY